MATFHLSSNTIICRRIFSTFGIPLLVAVIIIVIIAIVVAAMERTQPAILMKIDQFYFLLMAASVAAIFTMAMVAAVLTRRCYRPL